MKKLFLLISISASIFTALGCKKGTISSTSSGSSTGTLALSKAYPTSEGSSWTAIISSSRYYIKGLSLTVEGTCSPGIATIKVDEGAGVYAETASCSIAGTFTWQKTYLTGAQGDKTLNFEAYDISDAVIAGSSFSVDVRIDDTAPAAPVITTPATSPYDHNGATSAFTVVGTVSTDTTRVTGPGGANVTSFTNPNWSYNATLVEGSSLNFTFYAYDRAGNQSAGTTQTINWYPSAVLYVSGNFSATGNVSDGVTNYSVETTGSTVSAESTDGATNYDLLTGFNNIVNEL